MRILVSLLTIGLFAVTVNAAVVTYDFDAGMDGVSAGLTGSTMTYAIGTNSDGEPTAATRAWNPAGASGDYELNMGQRGVGNSGVADAAFDMGAASQLTFTLTPNAGEALDFSTAGLEFDSLIYADISGTMSFGYKVWADTGSGFTAVDVLQFTAYSTSVDTQALLLQTNEATALAGFSLAADAMNTTVTGYSFGLSSMGALATDQAVTLAITVSGNRNNQAAWGNSIDNLVVDFAPAFEAPAGLTADAFPARVELDWDNTVSAVSYNVYRSETSGSYGAVLTNVTDSAYSDTNVVNDTTYYYVVSSVDGSSAESAVTAEVSATPVDTPPAAPTGLAASPAANTVILNWDNNSEAEQDLASYNVYRSETPGSYGAALTNVAISAYTDTTGLTNGTPYYYVVTALDDSAQESTNSLEVSATPVDVAPATPTGVSAVAGNGEVNLDWTDNTEPAGDLAFYRVSRSVTSGSGYVDVANPTNSAYTDATVTNGVTYFYVVSAVDGAVQESANSAEVYANPAAGTYISVANLLDDPSFTSTPDTNLPTVTTFESFRFDLSKEKVQFTTDADTSGTNDSSSFTAPINLDTHTDVTDHANYDPATTRLTAITPNFNGADMAYTAVLPLLGGDQQFDVWYVITLATTGETYTATSGVGNLFDGSVAEAGEMEINLIAAWNSITWDVDPFLSGGIAYADINSIGIEFFEETLVANTTNSLTTWFNFESATLGYTAVIDGGYAGTLYLGDGTNSYENSPATWDTTSFFWGMDPNAAVSSWTNWIDGGDVIFNGDGTARTVNLATGLDVAVDELVWNAPAESILFVGDTTQTITITNQIRTDLAQTARQITLKDVNVGGSFTVANVSRLSIELGTTLLPGTEILAADGSDIQLNGTVTDFSGLSLTLGSGGGSTVYNLSASDKTIGFLGGTGEIRVATNSIALTVNNVTVGGTNNVSAITGNSSSTGNLVLGGGTHRFNINSSTTLADVLGIGAGSMTLGGDLIVTSTTTNNVALGDTFNLLDAASIIGSFNSVILPTDVLPAGAIWYNNLETDGTISVGTSDAVYETVTFADFSGVSTWNSTGTSTFGSITNGQGTIFTLTLTNVSDTPTDPVWLYSTAIAGIKGTNGNTRLDSFDVTSNVVNTANDEALRFELSISGTAVNSLGLKSLLIDSFAVGEIAEFTDGVTSIPFLKTVAAEGVVSYDDILAGLTELTVNNIDTWMLEIASRDNDLATINAFSIDDVTFLVGYNTSVGPTESPTIGSSVSGGSMVISWEDGFTYNILTNSDLTVSDGWGVSVLGAESPVTNTIGSETELFYKLEYE